MGLFSSRKPGLTAYELDRGRVRSRMTNALDGSRNSRNRKMKTVDAVLGQALDKDGAKTGRIQPEEFEQAMEGLVESDTISTEEAEKLREVTKKELFN